MLIEARAKERENLRKEGKLELIEQILQRRLGAMPTAVRDRLHRCTLNQLNTLVNPALDVTTWEELGAVLPQPKKKA